MARPLRIHMPGKAYHLFARGDNKMCIFRDDTDCTRFLELLTAALERFTVQCLAYCLLWNHYHLLVIPHEYSVSRLMQYLNGKYCRGFNRRHHRVGHVLQGRFGSRIVDDDEYMLTVLRYIALNPVAGGRVSRLEDWVWSSYRATAGLCAPPPFLAIDRLWTALGCSGADKGRAKYIAHVKKDAGAEEFEKVLVFGSELLGRQVTPLLEPHRNTRAFVYAERFATRPPLDDLLINADSTTALKIAARDAFQRHAYTLEQIGDMVGRSPSTISKWIRQVEASLH